MSPLQLPSFYRAVLRELPSLVPPSAYPIGKSVSREPLHRFTRSFLVHTADDPIAPKVIRARQMLYYLRSQRLYVELLERYNPGLTNTENNNVRRAARRVGLDTPT